MRKIYAYDFDGTIYNGDSSIDFILFCFKKKKSLLIYIPIILFYSVLYFIKIINTKKYKEKMFSFLNKIDNIEQYTNEFWKKNENKINNFFLEKIKYQRDVFVISASPEFLLNKYIRKFDNVTLIGTIMTKEGKIIGENCKGKEKIKRLQEIDEKIEIEEFYTDSINDLPLIEISKKSFVVSNENIFDYTEELFNKKKEKDNLTIIFLIFFCFYFFLGILITYNFDFGNVWDLLFNADNARVINDLSSIFVEHNRVSVHPLIILFLQPIYYLLNGIILNKMLTLVIMSSVVSSLSVVMIYKIFSMFSRNEIIKYILTFIFGLSFSNMTFASQIELYNYAAFGLILLLYFAIKILKSNEAISKKDYIVLFILGILSLSITITNFVVFLIVCLILVISKKIKLVKVIALNIIIAIVFIGLSYFQNFIWNNTPTIIESTFAKDNEETNYMDFSINIHKIKNVVKEDYFMSIIGSSFETINPEHSVLVFTSIDPITLYTMIVFYIVCLIFTIKNFKKNTYINLILITCLTFNSILHLIYGNKCTFLYSQHFLYLIILLFGINILEEKKYQKYYGILMIPFIVYQFLKNLLMFKLIMYFVDLNLDRTKLLLNIGYKKELVYFGLLLIVFISLLFLILKTIRQIINNRYDFILCFKLFTLFILLECLFVSHSTFLEYNKLLFIDFNENKSEEYISISSEKNDNISFIKIMKK